jgi:hypothetical protein
VSLAVEWRTEGPARAIVLQGGVLAARLFGAPFLIVGGYLAYQFIDGVLHPGELTWAGWTLLPLMTAAFLMPGWILTAGRRKTILDAGRREVVEVIDYRVYTRRSASPVSPDSLVIMRYQQGSTSSTSSTSFDIHVHLETPGRPLVLLALFRDDQKSDAHLFAAKAAAFLGITAQDRLVENGEVTAGGVVVDRLAADDAD